MKDKSDNTVDSMFGFIRDTVWTPERSGSYDQDCRMGRLYADQLLDAITRTGNPALFGTVARAITQGGVFDAVEVGFCSRIGIHIAVGATGAPG